MNHSLFHNGETMENSSDPQEGRNEQERKKIAKIHFLIHPGYMAKAVSPDFEEMTTHYLEKAKTLHDDELMIVFSYRPRQMMKSDIEHGRGYAGAVDQLKEILGPRLIVLTGDVTTPEGATIDFENAKKIAEARGYTFDRDVLTEAYGEEIDRCVQWGTNNLENAGHFSHETEIRPELTDAAIWEGGSGEKPEARI